MAILPIILSPNPLLKQKSAPVEIIDESIKTLVQDMFDTMYASNGIGLAAVQVGVLKRIIVVDTEWGSARYAKEGTVSGGNPIALINPRILEHSEQLRDYDEGCLSFPAQYSSVTRPDTITVEYMDIDGETHNLHADGLLSTCIQHEIDHINGVVFVDHLSPLKRDVILRKMKKAAKLKAAEE
jgi:peptide deformylase